MRIIIFADWVDKNESQVCDMEPGDAFHLTDGDDNIMGTFIATSDITVDVKGMAEAEEWL